MVDARGSEDQEEGTGRDQRRTGGRGHKTRAHLSEPVVGWRPACWGEKNEREVLKLRCRPPLGSLNVGISLGKVRILEASMLGGKMKGVFLELRCGPPLGSLNVGIS